MGASIINTKSEIPLLLSLSREPPPNIAAQPAILARNVIVPTNVAAIVLIKISRFFICESSCAITPSSSSRFNIFIIPVVTATAPLSGFLPVAKAFGVGLSIT